MNKNTFIPALPHTKISIPEKISKTKKSKKVSAPNFWNIKSLVNEDNLTEECQNRLHQNSQNTRKMIICILIIVFVLLANLALLYANFEDDKDASSKFTWGQYNTKPAADMLRPNIVPKQDRPFMSSFVTWKQNGYPTFNNNLDTP